MTAIGLLPVAEALTPPSEDVQVAVYELAVVATASPAAATILPPIKLNATLMRWSPGSTPRIAGVVGPATGATGVTATVADAEPVPALLVAVTLQL